MRHGYQDEKILDCWERLKSINKNDLGQSNIIYHSECYKSVTNATEIRRSGDRFAILKQQSSMPSNSNECKETTESRPNLKLIEKKVLRSATSVYDKSLCIICQKPGGKLHKVSYKSTGDKMLDVSKRLNDKSFFVRLNSIPDSTDAIANDVQYHHLCWVLIQRSTDEDKNLGPENDDVNRVLADIEIVNMVEDHLKSSSDAVLDMKSVNCNYNELLGLSTENNNKRYLKQLLQENIPGLVFIRPLARNESERICSSKATSSAVEKTYKNSWDSFKNIFETAKMVRSHILKKKNKKKWHFEGSFDGFEIPQSLVLLLQWIIIGPKFEFQNTAKKSQNITQSVNILGEIIMNLVKTNRQINYKSAKGHEGQFFNFNETPFTVGLGLHVHKMTRRKDLVEILSNVNLSIPYEKLVKIETSLANSVIKEKEMHSNVYISSNISIGMPLHYAIDNTDFKNDTPDGKSEFHGTGTVVLQKFDKDMPIKFLEIERNSKNTMKISK